jgi:hypothetical protein
MSNKRIDLQWLLEEDGLMQDLNWSIARFEQVEKLVKEMTDELKRCYEEIDELKELCHEFLGQALTLYDVGNQHKDVDYDYREFNKLRTRFAELLDFKSASE